MKLKSQKENKEKKTSKKEEKISKEEQEFLKKFNETRNEWIISYLFLDLLINAVEKDKNNVGNPGAKSMSDIDKLAKEWIKKLFESKEIKAIYKDKERKNEFKPILEELKNHKPTKWNDESFFAINIIKSKSTIFRKDDKNMELINKIESIFVWN